MNDEAKPPAPRRRTITLEIAPPDYLIENALLDFRARLNERRANFQQIMGGTRIEDAKLIDEIDDIIRQLISQTRVQGPPKVAVAYDPPKEDSILAVQASKGESK